MDEEPTIEFVTDHLLSKWGFADGEYLEQLLEKEGLNRWGEDSELWHDFTRLVLCEAVERFVCPRIENAIQPYRMATSHNPVRVYEVDGCHIGDWRELPTLRPAEVAVDRADILKLARELHQHEPDLMRRSVHNTRVFKEHGWN